MLLGPQYQLFLEVFAPVLLASVDAASEITSVM